MPKNILVGIMVRFFFLFCLRTFRNVVPEILLLKRTFGTVSGGECLPDSARNRISVTYKMDLSLRTNIITRIILLSTVS